MHWYHYYVIVDLYFHSYFQERQELETTRNVVVSRKNAVQQKNEVVDNLDKKIQHLKSSNQADAHDQENVQEVIRDLEDLTFKERSLKVGSTQSSDTDGSGGHSRRPSMTGFQGLDLSALRSISQDGTLQGQSGTFSSSSTTSIEVTKSTIVTTFSCHKYFQTSFDISRGFHLSHKILKVVFSNLNVDI